MEDVGDTIQPRGTPLSHLIFTTPGSSFYRQSTSSWEKLTDLVQVPAARKRQSWEVKQEPAPSPGLPLPFRVRKAPSPESLALGERGVLTVVPAHFTDGETEARGEGWGAG